MAEGVKQLVAEKGGTLMASLAAIFGESNPAQVSNTPRPAGNLPAKGEPVASAPIAVQYGWIGNDSYQTKGMSVLYIDQTRRMPDPEVQGIVRSAINHSRYTPYNHYRSGHWMFAGWDPIFRFANTYLDMRFQVGKPEPLSNENPRNLPGGVRMGPYNAPYRGAWQVPRFSTEPYTIIPKASPVGS